MFTAAYPRKLKMASGNVQERLKYIFSKHLKDLTLEDNYARGFIDGEESLNSFLKEFEALTHISYSTVKSEKRTETSKRYSSQGIKIFLIQVIWATFSWVGRLRCFSRGLFWQLLTMYLQESYDGKAKQVLKFHTMGHLLFSKGKEFWSVYMGKENKKRGIMKR